MIPRIIHLIWLGELLPDVRRSVEHHRDLNPGWEVRLTRNDGELMDCYRSAYDNLCRTPASKADLIRYSLLERYGGWYFDIDVRLATPVQQVEQQFGVDSLCISELIRGILANDILGAPTDWRGWEQVRKYVSHGLGHKLSCVQFSIELWKHFARDHFDLLRVIPAHRVCSGLPALSPIALRGRTLKPEAFACRYRSPQSIRTVRCTLCGDRERLVDVYQCALHGECTVRRYTAQSTSIAKCITCDDREDNAVTPEAIA